MDVLMGDLIKGWMKRWLILLMIGGMDAKIDGQMED